MVSFIARVVIAAALACSLAAPLRAEDTARAFEPGVVRRITPEEVQQRRDAVGSAAAPIVHGPQSLDLAQQFGDACNAGWAARGRRWHTGRGRAVAEVRIRRSESSPKRSPYDTLTRRRFGQ